MRLRIDPTWMGFGGTAAVVTSVGLILGLDGAASSTRAIVSALLIVALADNLSDSLGVHVYQEAEGLEPRAALRSTLANFATRLLVSLSFVAMALTFTRALLLPAAIAWGFLLLAWLTYRIARARGAPVGREIAKHLLIAALLVLGSRLLGTWIAQHLPPT